MSVGIGCSDSTPGSSIAPPAVKVVVEPVRTGKAVFYEEFPATVTPVNQVELRPQVSGFITGIHFRDGDRVKKGDLLYSVDAQLYNANYEQALANLRVQEANLARAEKDAHRYRELARNEAVAKQLLDNAEAGLEMARKQVEASSAAVAGVQTSVRYTKVFAPFSGVIGISQVKAGAPVTAGQTLLNTVSSDDELAVDINISQQEIYRFSKMVQDDAADSAFTLAFAGEAYPHPGKLAFLDRAVDPQTGTLKARLIFPNKDRLLRAGMNGTVRVKNSSDSATTIPQKALVEQLGEFFVYVPADSNKVTQRRVVPGTRIGADVIITEGLKPDDAVVTQGLQNLREGSVVQLVPAAPGNNN